MCKHYMTLKNLKLELKIISAQILHLNSVLPLSSNLHKKRHSWVLKKIDTRSYYYFFENENLINETRKYPY